MAESEPAVEAPAEESTADEKTEQVETEEDATEQNLTETQEGSDETIAIKEITDEDETSAETSKTDAKDTTPSTVEGGISASNRSKWTKRFSSLKTVLKRQASKLGKDDAKDEDHQSEMTKEDDEKGAESQSAAAMNAPKSRSASPPIAEDIFSFAVLDDNPELVRTMGQCLYQGFSESLDALKRDQTEMKIRQEKVIDTLQSSEAYLSDAEQNQLKTWFHTMKRIPEYQAKIEVLKKRMAELNTRATKLKASSLAVQAKFTPSETPSSSSFHSSSLDHP